MAISKEYINSVAKQIESGDFEYALSEDGRKGYIFLRSGKWVEMTSDNIAAANELIGDITNMNRPNLGYGKGDMEGYTYIYKY